MAARRQSVTVSTSAHRVDSPTRAAVQRRSTRCFSNNLEEKNRQHLQRMANPTTASTDTAASRLQTTPFMSGHCGEWLIGVARRWPRGPARKTDTPRAAHATEQRYAGHVLSLFWMRGSNRRLSGRRAVEDVFACSGTTTLPPPPMAARIEQISGWHCITSQIYSSVEKRIARALPVRIERFASVMLIRSASSVSVIRRAWSMSSSFTTMGMIRPCLRDRRAAASVIEDTGEHEQQQHRKPTGDGKIPIEIERLGRERGRSSNGADGQVQQFEVEERPRGRLQPRGVAGNERVTASHGLNDCQQSREQDVRQQRRACPVAMMRRIAVISRAFATPTPKRREHEVTRDEAGDEQHAYPDADQQVQGDQRPAGPGCSQGRGKTAIHCKST